MRCLRIALPVAILTCFAASALAMVPPPEPKFPWLKAGTVMKWNLVGAYDFVVTVKKLGTEVEFDYKMSNSSGTAGTVTIKEKGFAEGIAQNNYFGGGPLVLEDKTTVWVSKKVYAALKENKPLVINAEGEESTLKFVKNDKWTVTLEGKAVELPVLYGETDKGQKFWILDDPENPVICKMEISFTIELKEITPAK
jgi:hypothetical protein